MSLYEITGLYAEFMEAYGALDPESPDYDDLAQAQLDTLDMLDGEFDQNAEQIACVIKNLRSEAEALKKEEKAFAARRKKAEGMAERLTDYLLRSMDQVGKTKVHTILASLIVRNNPPAVRYTDLNALLFEGGEYVKPRRLTEDDLDKARIKDVLKSGGVVEGAELTQGRSLVIR